MTSALSCRASRTCTLKYPSLAEANASAASAVAERATTASRAQPRDPKPVTASINVIALILAIVFMSRIVAAGYDMVFAPTPTLRLDSIAWLA